MAITLQVDHFVLTSNAHDAFVSVCVALRFWFVFFICIVQCN